MFNKLIINEYINRINKNDIIKLGINQGIELDDMEVNIIYDYIKNRYEDILNNTELVLKEIKDEVNEVTYYKLLELYNKYKDKIS